MEVSVSDIATLVDGTSHGDADFTITGISGLAEAGPGDISFLADARYAPLLSDSKASAVIVREVLPDTACIQIVVADPNLAFAQVVETYGPQPRPQAVGVHSTAVVGEDAQLGANISIGPYAVIADGAVIGDNSKIMPHAYIGVDVRMGSDCQVYPHVTIREGCVLGDRVILHSGCVIGCDGFGYASLAGVQKKIPQVGIVEIGNDVEIGANTTIDRARFGKTLIGSGTKVDNLAQIAHNVKIGENCIIVAQVGIAGSTTVGKEVTIAGQSGITGHISIGDNAIVAGKSGVSKNVPPQMVVQGMPAQNLKNFQSQQACLRRLPQTQKQVKQLEARISELEELLKELKQGS